MYLARPKSVIATLLFHLSVLGLCSADTYPPFAPQLEFSASRMMTTIVRPLPADTDARSRVSLSVLTRYDIGRKPLPAYGRTPDSLHSGAAKLVANLDLDYEPGVVRVSDTHLALVDRYGINRNWLAKNPAIRLVSLEEKPEIRINLEQLVADVSSCVHVSDSTLSWYRDAWFSIDGMTLYVALWKAKNADANDALHAINVVDGSTQVIDSAQIENVFSQSEKRFYPTLFDLATAQQNSNLGELARSVWKDDDLSLNVRVHAAAYSLLVLEDSNALDIIRSIAMLSETSGADRPPDIAVIRSYYDDPVAFALKVLRNSATEQEQGAIKGEGGN